LPWTIEEHRAPAGDLHALGLPSQRVVRLLEATRPALVLGSTQQESIVVGDVTGLDVVRRRSGGGAVLVEPGGVAWIDVAIARTDPLWDDDVGRAFHWLGDAWAAALVLLGVVGADVHRGGLVRTALSDLVCFAGLGPGEVTVGGAKVVGMAQRRTREGALFQCAVPIEWNPDRLAILLGLERVDAPVLSVVGRTQSELLAALVAQLPED
jgi:lipoate-protein ligase A